jgi:hypothetical protein
LVWGFTPTILANEHGPHKGAVPNRTKGSVAGYDW